MQSSTTKKIICLMPSLEAKFIFSSVTRVLLFRAVLRMLLRGIGMEPLQPLAHKGADTHQYRKALVPQTNGAKLCTKQFLLPGQIARPILVSGTCSAQQP